MQISIEVTLLTIAIIVVIWTIRHRRRPSDRAVWKMYQRGVTHSNSVFLKEKKRPRRDVIDRLFECDNRIELISRHYQIYYYC